MGLLTVTLGVNQHVSGIGTTLLLVAACDYANRLLSAAASRHVTGSSACWFPQLPVLDQYLMTYLARCWSPCRCSPGCSPAPGSGCGSGRSARTRRPPTWPASAWRAPADAALLIGGGLMAVGGAFLTLAVVGTFTLNIAAGRGWVAIALVIFGRWRIWGALAGALLFAGVDALQLQLAITSTFAHVPREI